MKFMCLRQIHSGAPSGNSGKVFKLVSPTTAVSDFNKPGAFKLFQNYPNPFNPSTNIKYRLPEPELVSLKVYDVPGRQIASLVNEQKAACIHSVNFDASGLQAAYISTQ